ncbi:MAG: hypothetical protein LBQ12_10770 [Deltaproteobacteria bacterium]|jgi:hypothetical protein|nr:hypothetical protein [Deltaproteobacteria bacterium]
MSWKTRARLNLLPRRSIPIFRHGYPVSRAEAQKIGLYIVKLDCDLESIMRNIRLYRRDEMKCGSELSVYPELLGNLQAKQFFSIITAVDMPVKKLTDVVSKINTECFRRNASAVRREPVEMETLTAPTESYRLAYAWIRKYLITWPRGADTPLSVDALPCTPRWKRPDVSRS